MKLHVPDDLARELARVANTKGMRADSFALAALRQATPQAMDDAALMDRIVAEARMLTREDTVATAESLHEASTERLPPY